MFKPLTNAELTELDELLAQMDEKNIAMDASEADGFMTAILLLPEEVLPKEWMPYIFSADPTHAHLLSPKKQNRLEELLYRRYLDIDRALSQGGNITEDRFNELFPDGKVYFQFYLQNWNAGPKADDGAEEKEYKKNQFTVVSIESGDEKVNF